MNLFAKPEWLWLLAIAPVLAVFIAWANRRRLRDWQRLGQEGKPPRQGGWAWLGAMLCLALALAQPRWGRAAGEKLPPGQDVVLLIDTSRSMGAQDAVPDRLGVGIEAAESLVRALGKSQGSRIAVVAFAGRAVVRCPLTENLGAVGEALSLLHPGDVRPGGTNLAAGLDLALEALGSEEALAGRTIVVLSDGEDHAGTWESLLPRLRQAQVIVHTIVIGDPAQGHPIPTGPEGAALVYQGNVVLSQRTDSALEALAKETGGAFIDLGLAATDLGSLYHTRIAPVARRKQEALRAGQRIERFGLFVMAGIGLSLLGCWPGRRRLRRLPGLISLLAVALLIQGAAPEGQSAIEAVAAGRASYRAGQFDQALAAFERAMHAQPRLAVPRYNAASALFQLGRYAEAAARYREARNLAEHDPSLQTKIDYALGNTALLQGDIPEAIQFYEACLASRARGHDLDAVRRDAAANRQYALELAKRSGSSGTPPEQPQAPQLPQPDDKSPPDAKKKPENPDEKNPSEPPDSSEPPNPIPRPKTGGAGGTGEHTPKAGSPESRLAEALQNIREARRRRLSDDLPSGEAEVQTKDW